MPTPAALSRQSELVSREWAPSIAYIDMTDIRVPDPGFEWRIDVCVRGNKAKGCPRLVLTALVTAVGEYAPSTRARVLEREFETEAAGEAAPAGCGSGTAAPATAQASCARRRLGGPARPLKRRCVGP
jgi:hypothetical protein